jgi:tetrapyrrole methylase family protein/MazG family protein
MNSFSYYVAEDFLKREINCFDFNVPTIIDQIKEEDFSSIKSKIIRCFSGNVECTVLDERGNPTEVRARELGYKERFIIKASNFLSRDYYSFGDLLEIIRKLRDPDGCPWDRVQTHNSIKNNAIEEAYELAEAIDLDDTEKLIEESGDVLLQGLFHAVIAEDSRRFNANDLINGLCHKLVSRHTHVFGEQKAPDAHEALKSWEKAKSKEKNQNELIDKINSVPVTFGALMRAFKVQKIIKKTGFDFPNPDSAKQKITEELLELDLAEFEKEKEWEGGDLLFAVINYLRMLGIDPETSLNATTNRFIDRFLYVEKKSKELGFELSSNNMDLMEKYYQESKEHEDSTWNNKKEQN